MPTPEHLLLVAFIIGASFAIQTAIGFGGGLIAAPLLALVIGAKDTIPILLIFQFLMGAMLYNEWRNISFRPFMILVPSIVLGISAGMLANGYLSERWVTLGLAAYLLLFVVADVAQNYGLYAPRPTAVLSGLSSGVIQALFGTGGPPLVAYLHSLKLDKTDFRATAMALFFFMNLVRLAVAIPAHEIHWSTIAFALAAFPSFLFALEFGSWLHDVVPVKTFRAVVVLFLAVSASVLFFRGMTLA